MQYIYIVSVRGNTSKYKLGSHTGTYHALQKRYQTYLINPEIALFFAAENAEYYERKCHELLRKTGRCVTRYMTDESVDTEWYDMSLALILHTIQPVLAIIPVDQIQTNVISVHSLAGKLKIELEDMCNKLGLAKTGNKDVLIQRLVQHHKTTVFYTKRALRSMPDQELLTMYKSEVMVDRQVLINRIFDKQLSPNVEFVVENLPTMWDDEIEDVATKLGIQICGRNEMSNKILGKYGMDSVMDIDYVLPLLDNPLWEDMTEKIPEYIRESVVSRIRQVA